MNPRDLPVLTSEEAAEYVAQLKDGDKIEEDLREKAKLTVGLLINNLLLDKNAFETDLLDQTLVEIPPGDEIMKKVLQRVRKLYAAQDELKVILTSIITFETAFTSGKQAELIKKFISKELKLDDESVGSLVKA